MSQLLHAAEEIHPKSDGRNTSNARAEQTGEENARGGKTGEKGWAGQRLYPREAMHNGSACAGRHLHGRVRTRLVAF
eukprot:75398-Chlamydomonas_euryale.AAC.1